MPRVAVAAALLAALVVALLGAWFATGWEDVRARQRRARDAPIAAAAQRAGELARELHGELEALLARETRRPYFHYQNLMRDPKASAGLSVSPSPLARGPEDPLVLGYFQLDVNGRATTPTINDEVPELSEQDNLPAHRAFRDQVVRELARELAPLASGMLVASADPRARRTGTPQVIEIDPSTYAQNLSSNAVYWHQHDAAGAVSPTPRGQIPTPPPAPVTITITALEWRTLPFGGAAVPVAVRQVHTPDGTFAQGFVVDRATVTARLAAKAGELVAQLRAGPAGGAPIAPGWELAVAPNPRAVAAAARDAHAIARGFVIRFAGVSALAVAVAGCVLLLVARAERLARERSQFAAAAAHELRTPLAGIQLYGDMLADGLGDRDKASDYARRMSEEAARLGRVVSNVLGFSQLERGSLTVDAQVGDLGATLAEMAERAEPALDRAGAALELDVAPVLRARFDRDALARIVGNLLDNAEKYARGAADRTIRLAASERGDAVEIEVVDRGPGVGDPARLFAPFSRGAAADGPAGLGLGLALSRSLARAMGGELSYRPADGGGAAFVLRVPRA